MMQKSECRNRRLEFKGGSFHDGFDGFDVSGGSGEHSALFSLVLQNAGERGKCDGSDGSGSFVSCGGFGRDGYHP